MEFQAIAVISASDNDVGYGGLVRFSMWDDYFTIEAETGVIRVAGDLTELLMPGVTVLNHDVEITASDEGSPRKTSKKTVKIRIEDVNNHAPQFQEVWYLNSALEFCLFAIWGQFSNTVGTIFYLLNISVFMVRHKALVYYPSILFFFLSHANLCS